MAGQPLLRSVAKLKPDPARAGGLILYEPACAPLQWKAEL